MFNKIVYNLKVFFMNVVVVVNFQGTHKGFQNRIENKLYYLCLNGRKTDVIT